MTPASAEMSPSPVLEMSRLNDSCRGAVAECELLPSRSAGSVRVLLVESMESLCLSLPLILFLPMAEAMRHPTAGHPLHSLSCPESGATSQCPGSSRCWSGQVPLVLVQLSHPGTIPDLCYFSWDGSLVYTQGRRCCVDQQWIRTAWFLGVAL